MSLRPPTDGTPSTVSIGNAALNTRLTAAESDVAVVKEAPLNVQQSEYGALGTNTGDDTTAINAAITAAAAANSGNGGEVYIPPGTYPITSLLHRGNVRIIGGGKTNTQLFQISGTANVLAQPADPTSAEQALYLAHLTLTAFGNQTANTGGIDLFRTSKSVLDQVKVSYFKNWGVRGKGGASDTAGDAMRNTFRDCEIANGQASSVGYLGTNGSDQVGATNGGGHPDGTIFIGGLMQNTPTAWRIDAPPSNGAAVFAPDCLTVIGTQIQECPTAVDLQGGWGHRFIGCRWENTAGVMNLVFGPGTTLNPVFDAGFLACSFLAAGNPITITDTSVSPNNPAYWTFCCLEDAHQSRTELRDPITFARRLSAPYRSNSLYRDSGDQVRWQDHNGGNQLVMMSKITSISAAGTTTGLTLDRVLKCDATAGNITYVPASAANTIGAHLYIKKVDASANTVTIDPSGAETIDGAATKVLSTQWASIHLVSDGTNWLTV